MSAPLRCIAYVRQSLTDDADDSLSLAMQERAIRAMVAKQGGVLIEPPIIDADQKGWDPSRPGIATLMARIEREQPDALAVYAVSRLARDNLLLETLWRRAQLLRPGIVFQSVTEPHADDDLVRGILGLFAQADRKRMGAFLSSAFRERARQGKAHGRPPFGFQKDDDGRLVIVPEERDLILTMIERYEAGWSQRRIAAWLRETAPELRRWDGSTVRVILAAPANAGAIRCGDVLQWDSHDPIIDRERFERLTATIGERRVVRTKQTHSWLERRLLCGCGAPLDLFGQRPNRRNRSYPLFRCAASTAVKRQDRRPWHPCTARPRSILVSRAERLTVAALVTAFDQIRDWRAVERDALAAFAALTPDADRQRAALDRQVARVNDERDRLLVLYRRRSLDVERWEREDRTLADRMAALLAERAAIPEPPQATALQETAAQLAQLGAYVRLLASADPAALGAVMRERGIMAQLHDGGLRLVWPAPLAPFFSAVTESAR